MQDIVDRISNAGDLVFDPFDGSYTSARYCMLLQLHRHCVVSDHEHDCWKHGLQQLIEVFEKKVFNESSFVIGIDEV